MTEFQRFFIISPRTNRFEVFYPTGGSKENRKSSQKSFNLNRSRHSLTFHAIRLKIKLTQAKINSAMWLERKSACLKWTG